MDARSGVWITLLMTSWSIPHYIQASKRSFNRWACKELFREKLCFARHPGMRGKERAPSTGRLPVACQALRDGSATGRAQDRGRPHHEQETRDARM